LSNLENGKNEVNGLIGYFSQYCLNTIDLNTDANMHGSNVSSCAIRYKNFIKIKKEKLPFLLFFVTPNHYGSKRKWEPISWLRNLILQKLIKGRQLRENFFTHPYRKIKQNPLVFNISKYSKVQDLVGVTQVKVIQEVSSGLRTIKFR